MNTGYRPRGYTVEEEFAVLDENAIDAEFTVVDDGRNSPFSPVRLPHPDSRPLTDGSQTSD